MDHQDLKIIRDTVASSLHLSQGEISYWGEVIQPSPKPVSSTISVGLNKSQKLQQLHHETIGDCQRCPLAPTRTKVVFGVGNPDSKVMFIGEGPGFDEDKQGEPFVGKAGQLLDKILQAIQLDRSKVYIANIVKCHPMIDPSQPDKRGNDRPPETDEMAACLPFLLQQISIVQPRFIVALGATATKALLNTSVGITKLRGKWAEFPHELNVPPIQVLPTYHPAALLRNPDLKRDVWEDMKVLKDALLN